jgi:hypothetical protein
VGEVVPGLYVGVVASPRAVISWSVGRWLIALVVALAAAACGGADNAGHPVAPVPPDTGLTPPDTISFDLRFKGIGVLTDDSVLPGGGDFLCTDAVCESPGGFAGSGTPMEIGSGLCDPGGTGGCGWQFQTYALPPGVGGLEVVYRGDFLTRLGSVLDSAVTTDTVITGLDLEPVDGVFAVSQYATTLKGGYNRAHHVVALGGLQSAATQAGAQARVITAVSFDSGQVHYVSYGWKLAPTAIYETQVATATAATISSVAQSLGGSGYFITAVGGEPTDGFVLVGTRVRGVTTPRVVQVLTVDVSVSGPFTVPSGAIVGYITIDPPNTLTFIVES